MQKIHRHMFLKEVKETYPERADDLNRQEGVFSREVAVFLEFVQRLIDSEDCQKVEVLLNRVDRYYSTGDRALNEFTRNGVCEDLRFEDTKVVNRSWALAYLSPALTRERELWIERMGPWARK